MTIRSVTSPLLLLGVFISTPALAEKEEYWTFGVDTLPLTITGLEDIHLSDWQTFGTGVLEGRVNLPLSTGATSGQHAGGIVGYHKENWLGEFQFAVGKGGSSIVAFLGGYDFAFYKTGSLTFSAVPKLGIYAGTISMGKAKLLPGKLSPVHISEGDVKEGDNISANFLGIGGQTALSAIYDLGESAGLEFQLGYNYAYFSDMQISAGNVNIEKNSPALVKADGSTTQAGINPQAKSNGVFAMLGFSWVF